MGNELQLSNRQKTFFGVLVCLIIPLSGMSTDIYLPSLPAIAQHFQTGKSLSQVTVTSFVLALALSQLIAGPVSDAMGRKILILTALFVQFLAIVAIIYSPTIQWMIGLRFLQGLGAAFMMVPVRAINMDVLSGHALKKQLNYNTISFAIGPIIAPFIGGYLQHHFGWQSNFYFLLIYIIIVSGLVLLFYRETLSFRHSFSIRHLWKNYDIILRNFYFLLLGIFLGTLWGYVAIFNITAPLLVQTVLQRSAITYGHIALIMGVALFLGNIINRLSFYMDKKIKIQGALWSISLLTLIMLILSGRGHLSLTLLTIPTFFIIFFSGIIIPILMGEAMIFFPELAASANACFFTLIWLTFSLFTYLATWIKIHSLFPLAMAYLCINLFCLIAYYGFIRRLD
ncbi:MFS transporter [Coxiella burnetii]|uniref:MFS transporter n=1 Tax=Coxiella burnetii TaxID=777 RepID=UPI00217689EC|nr:MFS transporter [Coxiella burnetii]